MMRAVDIMHPEDRKALQMLRVIPYRDALKINKLIVRCFWR